MLRNVGDRSKEWEEWRRSGKYYHLRRRLTLEEQKITGEAIDLRGSQEAQQRFEMLCTILPAPAIELGRVEIIGR